MGGGYGFGDDGVGFVAAAAGAVAYLFLAREVWELVQRMAFDLVDDHSPCFVGLERQILQQKVASCIGWDCKDYLQNHGGSEKTNKMSKMSF